MHLEEQCSVLSVHDLCVSLGQQRVLDAVSFHVEAGAILSFVGPNGAGKSTLLNAIGGITPCSGDITLQAAPALNSEPSERASSTSNSQNIWRLPAVNKALFLAYLPQQSFLNFPFTVKEVVALGRFPHSTGASVDEGVINEVMRTLDIAHLAARNYLTLSGGEQQRTQLARVFSQVWLTNNASGRFLLLDEPLESLDIGHKQMLIGALVNLAQAGVTIVIAEHDLNIAKRVSSHVGVLKAGRLVSFGKPSDILTPQLIKTVFNAEVQLYANSQGGTHLGF